MVTLIVCIISRACRLTNKIVPPSSQKLDLLDANETIKTEPENIDYKLSIM
jgi:hypothetical protein